MKRSKIFLGLTTCCLAIAGAVAAKVTHFGTVPGKYFTTGLHCVSRFLPCGISLVGGATCVYSYSNILGNPIKTAVYTAVNACTTIFKYSAD
jgi:hypothetical protein